MISQRLQKVEEDSDDRQHSMIFLSREIRILDSQCFEEQPGRVAVYNMC